MNRKRKVTGNCFRGTCTRKAKIEQACRLCDEATIRSCQFHRDRAAGELRDHVIRNHPVEFRAAQRAASAADNASAVQVAAHNVFVPVPGFVPVK